MWIRNNLYRRVWFVFGIITKSILIMPKLFSYGTLQYPKVQMDTYGRLLKGIDEELLGYRLEFVKITDTAVLKSSGLAEHPILRYSGNMDDKVKGLVFEITDDELLQSDKYEVDDYKRVIGEFNSGIRAWVYVGKWFAENKLPIPIKYVAKSLSEKLGVSLGSIKRFENSGEISLKHILKLTLVLDALDEFHNLFPKKKYNSIDDIFSVATKTGLNIKTAKEIFEEVYSNCGDIRIKGW